MPHLLPACPELQAGSIPARSHDMSWEGTIEFSIMTVTVPDTLKLVVLLTYFTKLPAVKTDGLGIGGTAPQARWMSNSTKALWVNITVRTIASKMQKNDAGPKILDFAA